MLFGGGGGVGGATTAAAGVAGATMSATSSIGAVVNALMAITVGGLAMLGTMHAFGVFPSQTHVPANTLQAIDTLLANPAVQNVVQTGGPLVADAVAVVGPDGGPTDLLALILEMHDQNADMLLGLSAFLQQRTCGSLAQCLVLDENNLSALDNTVGLLDASLANTNTLVATHTIQIDGLELRVTILEGGQLQLQSAVSNLTVEVLSLDGRTSALEGDVAWLESNATAQQFEIDALQLCCGINSTAVNVTELFIRIVQNEQDVLVLQQTVVLHDGRLVLVEACCAANNASIASLDSRVTLLEASAHPDRNPRIDALNSTLVPIAALVAAHKTKIDALNSTQVSLLLSVANHDTRILALEAFDHAGLLSTVILLNTSLPVLQSNLASLNTTVGGVQGDVLALQNSVAAIQGDLSIVNGSVVTLGTEVAALNGSLVVLEGAVVSVNGSVIALEGAIVSLNGSVITLQAGLASVVAAVTVVDGKVDTLNVTVGLLDGRVTTLEAFDHAGLLALVTALNTTVNAFDGRITTLEAFDHSGLLSLVISLNTTVNAFDGRITTLEAFDHSGLQSLVVLLNTTVYAFDGRITTLEAFDHTGLLALVTLLNTTVNAFDGRITTLEAFDHTGLLALVTALNSTVVAHDGRITTLEAFDHAGLLALVTALNSAVATHDGRITALEAIDHAGMLAAIAALQSGQQTLNNTAVNHTAAIGALQTSVASLSAGQTLLDGRVSTLEAFDHAGLVMRVNALNSTQVSLLAISTSHETRLLTIEGTLPLVQADVAVLQSNVTALSSGQAALDVRVSALEAIDHAGIIGRIDALNNTQLVLLANVSTLASGQLALQGNVTALASGQAALDARITVLEAIDHAGIVARINTLNNTQIVLLGNVSSLDTRTALLEGSVSTLQSDVVGIDARLTAAEGSLANTLNVTDMALVNSMEGKPHTGALLRGMLADISTALGSVGGGGSGDNCSKISVESPGASFDIAAAVAEAVSRGPSRSNPQGIELCPGVYTVDNSLGPLTLPGFVSLVAPAGNTAVFVKPLDPSKTLFVLGDGDHLVEGIQFEHANATVPFFSVPPLASGVCNFEDVISYGYGLLETAANATMSLRIDKVILIASVSPAVGLTIRNAPAYVAHDIEGVTLDVVDSMSGAGVVGLLIEGVTNHARPTVVNTLNARRVDVIVEIAVGCVMHLDNLYGENVGVAIVNVTSPSAEVYLSNLLKVDTTNGLVSSSAVYVGNPLARVLVFGDELEYVCDSGPKPPNVDGVYVDTNTREGNVQRAMVDVSVGLPEKPHSLYAGDGKHTFRNLLVYASVGGGPLVDMHVGNCVGNSTVVLAPSLNSALYMAVNVDDPRELDSYQHYGLYVTVATAAVLGATGVITPEYWDGVAWRPFHTMSYQDTEGFPSIGPLLFTALGQWYVSYSPRIRYSNVAYPESAGVVHAPWATNDPPGIGTPRYWVRFRVSSALTSGPALSYVAYTGNTHEWGVNGEHIFHGKTRKYRQLASTFSDIRSDVVGDKPSSKDVFHSNIAVGFSKNTYVSGQTDAHGWMLFVPSDIDTSAPIRMSIYFTTTGTGTGNVQFQLNWASISQGDGLYDNPGQALADLNTNERTDVFLRSVTTVEQLATQTFHLEVPEFIPRSSTNSGSLVMIELTRNGAAAPDTFNNALVVVGFVFEYLQRMEGMPVYDF